MTKPKLQIVSGPVPTNVGPMNVVMRKDAETAARVAYATGRRDALTTLADEMKVLEGEFLAVSDMIDAIEKAAVEFTEVIEQLEAGGPKTPDERARERIIVPS